MTYAFPADVAKAALRTLLRGVAFLAADHLQAVLVRCAQCSMSSEISSLAARTVADGTGASAETAALVAALVEDSNLAQKTLKSSGAACFNNVQHRCPNVIWISILPEVSLVWDLNFSAILPS